MRAPFDSLRSLRAGLLLALGLALVATHAEAVETTGHLKGKVRDESAAALSGATVTISSPALLGGARTATTDGSGHYRFPALPVGDYAVKVELAGRLPRAANVTMLIGQTVTLDFALTVPTAEETIVITSGKPTVDTEKTSSGQTMGAEFLQNVPSGRTYQEVARFAPGVSGGSNPNVHGETLYSNSYLLDGVNITDPVTHTFSTNFNFDAIEAIEVITGGYDAEYGQATGAIVNIVTKSGSNELEIDTSVYYGDYNLTSGGRRTNGDFRDASANVNVGGPIVKDKVWFFTSYEYDDSRLQASETVSPLTGAQVAEPRIFQGHLYLAKITWQVSPSHKIAVHTQGDPSTIKNVGVNASQGDNLLFPSAQYLREQGGANYSASWDWVVNNATLFRAQVGYVDSVLNEFSARRDFRTPGHSNTEGESTYNAPDFYWDSRRRIVAHVKATRFVDDFAGSHRVKAGIDANFDTYPVTNGYSGDIEYVDAGYQTDGAGNVLTDANGNPIPKPFQKIEYSGTLRSTTRGRVIGIWAQDEWKPIETLTLKVGLRVDQSRFENDVGAAIVDFLTFAPRLYAAWAPSAKSVFTAGYAQSYDNGSLLVPDFVKKRGLEGRVFFWDGSQYSYAYSFGGEDGTETKKLRAPVKHEIQVSTTREVMKNVAVGLRLIASRSLYNFEDDESNLIWNADGSEVIGYKDGTNHFVYSLGTPAIAYRDYRGLELTFSRDVGDEWFIGGSYTLSDTRGTSDAPITGFLDNPAQNRWVVDSELPYAVSNALKLQTTYELPRGFQVGAAYVIEAGTSYDRLYYNDYYQGYYDYRAKRGQYHYAPSQELDLRLQWSTRVAGKDLSVVADVFNALDRRAVLERRQEYEHTLSDDDPNQPFGRVLDRQTPLHARLGVRYEF